MIITERKPLAEILELVRPYRKVLILGCGGCVTVCQSGGAKEVELLRAELELALGAAGEKPKKLVELTPTRQCDPEFLEEQPLREAAAGSEVVLSLACGAGVQLAAELLGAKVERPVLPGANTLFLGATVEPGIWLEYCAGCGSCRLAETAGICPVARCSKGLLNGPCGGTFSDGSCEVARAIPCAGRLIFERRAATGKSGDIIDVHYVPGFPEIAEPLDWRRAAGGAPRRVERAELKRLEEKKT